MRGHSLIFRLGALAVILMLSAAASAPVANAAAIQELAHLDRGPRFLREVKRGMPHVEIDMTRTPVLYRRISLGGAERTLRELIATIGKASGLEFVYSADLLPVNRPMRFRADSITVAAALTEILLDAGVDVVFYSAKQAGLVRQAGPHGAGAVTGRVTDAKTGASLNTAEVFLENTRWSTTTDSGGNFILADVDSGAYTLVARRLGYTKQVRKITVRGDRTDTVHVSLEPMVVKMNELVATATGLQRRRDLGNAVTTIRADSILKGARIHNLTDLLEGRVPGLTTQHTTGAPGDPARIRLRGLSSVRQSNNPVVVVDGIRINSDQSSQRSGNLTNSAAAAPPGFNDALSSPVRTNNPAPSPLDQIDPNIIEKIEVFKGPSAATLYGADAANGVIVITTKRGKPGPTRWNASVTQSRTTRAGDYPLAYFRWGHRELDGGIVTMCPVAAMGCTFDSLITYQALNDPDATVLGIGHRTALSLTASGGSQALTYSVTGSYSDERGPLKLPQFEAERFRTTFKREPFDWMKRPHRYKTWNVSSNINALLGSTADVTLSAQLSSADQQRASLEDKLAALQGAYISRTAGCCLIPGVILSGNDVQPYGVTFANPLTDYYTKNTASMISVTTNVNANWRPRSWFTGAVQAGISIEPRLDEAFLPPMFSEGAIIRGTGLTRTGTFDIRGNFRKPLPAGFIFETSAGANITTLNTHDVVSSAWKLAPGTTSLVGARRSSNVDNLFRSSVFGWYLEPRITGQRFSISTGIRLDGGSAYGARVTGFGSGGGGFLKGLLALPKLNGSWVISEEPWFPFTRFFSSLRLRGAYGQAQVQPGVADRLRTYRFVDDLTDAVPPVLELAGVGNDALRPERSTEFEGGFDADVLDSRVSIELTAYRKVQVDALMTTTLPGSINGGGTVIRNIGNIRNTGLELTTSFRPIQTSFLTWSVNLNYSRNTNVLTKLGENVAPDYNNGLVAGYPIGGRWSLPISSFADQNGDGAIQRSEVQVGDTAVFMGRLLPAYESSFGTNLELFGQAVRIVADFQYEGGNTQIDGTATTNWVLSRALADPSTALDQQAAVAALDRTTYGVTQTVSTFRFRSVSVNYRVPAPVMRFFRAQSMTLSLRGDNLGLHTSYRGKDPDVTAWSAGEGIIDTGQLTRPRTWELAVFMSF